MSQFLQHRPLCLASSSPRRKMFLKKYGLQFDCHTPRINEKPEKSESAKSFVKRMAHEKALQVQRTYSKLAEDVIILAGDTIVYFDGKILGKPKSILDARTMLTQLSGRTHQVFSGYSILDSSSGNQITDLVCTEVRLLKLNADLLEWYLNSKEPFDKAGAYSIQGLGAILVESISGSYSNVVGFPIECIIPNLTANGWISFAENTQHEVYA